MSLSDREISYAGTRNLEEGFFLTKDVKATVKELDDEIQYLDKIQFNKQVIGDLIREKFGKQLVDTQSEPKTNTAQNTQQNKTSEKDNLKKESLGGARTDGSEDLDKPAETRKGCGSILQIPFDSDIEGDVMTLKCGDGILCMDCSPNHEIAKEGNK